MISRYCTLIAAVGLLATAAARPEARTPTEYEVKAAFIYNFARYVQWPGGSEQNKPFVIGVIGKDPFGPVLDDVVRGQSVQGRAVVVRRFQKIEHITNCDMLFVSGPESDHLQRIFDALDSAPVLTVGDMDKFAELGGMINLITEDNHIRFEMNVQAIERSGLKAGSQLLKLAKIVNERRLVK